MMLLADCVTLFSENSKPTQSRKTIPQEKHDLIAYIKALGEVCEVRAVAYHDIATLTQALAKNE